MTETSDRYPDLVQRFWREVWAVDNEALLAELLSPEITFRGSLGLTASGHDGVSGYVRTVQGAIPDFAVRIEEVIHDGDRVVTRITFSGTHQGTLFEVPGDGERVAYPGIAIHRFENGRMVDVWVVGDTLNLARQLGQVSIQPGVTR
ncbi:MAG: ester cyclase [Nitrospirota bacterium]|nr:ester cyclase [Nitrospirota bacterium]